MEKMIEFILWTSENFSNSNLKEYFSSLNDPFDTLYGSVNINWKFLMKSTMSISAKSLLKEKLVLPPRPSNNNINNILKSLWNISLEKNSEEVMKIAGKKGEWELLA